MDWRVLVSVLFGLLVGIVSGLIAHRHRRRDGLPPEPELVAGDRPVVMLHVEAETYDLTDTGVRRDDPDGTVHWEFTAPVNVFTDDVTSIGHITVPVLPPRTTISVLITNRPPA